jgi:hypothetical protein
MIPHRLENEVSDSGLRDRVTACRKRLRESRTLTKANLNSDAEDLFPEIAPTGLRIRTFSGRNPRGESRTFLQMEDEVGIT